MVQILLNGVADVNQEGFVQRIAIYLLNSLACQVDGKQKTFLGNQGAIGVSNFVLFYFFLTVSHQRLSLSQIDWDRRSKSVFVVIFIY